jgi:hypothetical protein
MKNYHPPSGLTGGLKLLISKEWTPEQAWAVVELLDDLRDRIWCHYQIPIQELLRDEYGVTEDQQKGTTKRDDLTF